MSAADDEDALLAAAIAASLDQPPDAQGPEHTETPAEACAEAPTTSEAASIVPPAPRSTTVDLAALFERLEVQAMQDRASGLAPLAPDGPVGPSLIEFLQICLARHDVAVSPDLESCVQLRSTRQHNNHSCGYFAFYYAKTVLDVVKARTEVAALRVAAGLANGDRGFQFAKKVHASLEQSILAQTRLQSKDAKELFEKFELSRSDAADICTHPLLEVHKDDITLVCDPAKLEPASSTTMNPSIRDIDVIFADLRSGLRPFHAFVFGAADHFYTLFVWSRPKTDAEVAEPMIEAAAMMKTEAETGEGTGTCSEMSCESSTSRHFELILFDSENEKNLTFNVDDAPKDKQHLKKRIPEVRKFVSLVLACTRDGAALASRQVAEAAEAFLGHAGQLMDEEGRIKPSLARKGLSNPTYVHESIHLLEGLLNLSEALKRPIQLETPAAQGRLHDVIRSIIQTIAEDLQPKQLGSSPSNLRPLPLSRTLSGTLWVARQDELLRSLAKNLGLDGLPDNIDWGPPIAPPSDELAGSLRKGCHEAIDMDEARELLIAVAYERGREQAVEADVQTAVQLLQEEQKKRPMCLNGHALTKGKRQKSWCNFCNNGYVPQGVDPATFLALPKELQQEQREEKKCFIMSDYLCKHCEYFCCEKCFLGRGRGTVLQACLRASRGIADPPDTEWRCYDDYDTFPGQNAAEEPIADYPEKDADPEVCDAAVLRGVEVAKAKCIESGYGGFAVFKGMVYFRRQSTADCHANLQPADGTTFYVAPKLVDAAAAEREAQEAQQRTDEHRAKIAGLKELVGAMGLGSLTEHQAVYWLEQGSYVPENAVAGLLDAFERFDLNPPAGWTSSCSGLCCRPV